MARLARHLGPQTRHPAGLILLEVVLSVTLFVLSVVLIGASVRSSMMATSRDAQREQGLALAKQVLARIRAGDLPAANEDAGTFPQFPNYTYTVALSDVTTTPVQVQNLRQILVTVTWPVDSANTSGPTDSVTLNCGWQYYGTAPDSAQAQAGADSSGTPAAGTPPAGGSPASGGAPTAGRAPSGSGSPSGATPPAGRSPTGGSTPSGGSPPAGRSPTGGAARGTGGGT